MLDKQLPPHVDRMAVELRELDDRITKLREFKLSLKFKELTEIEQHWLIEQYRAMRNYYDVLVVRWGHEMFKLKNQ